MLVLDTCWFNSVTALLVSMLDNVLDTVLVGALGHAELYGEVSSLVLGTIHGFDGVACLLSRLEFDKCKPSVHVRSCIQGDVHVFDLSKAAIGCLEMLLT